MKAISVELGALLFLASIGLTRCQSGTNAKDLYTYLFTTNAYQKKVRPATDQSQYTNVTVGLALTSINDVNELAETITSQAELSIQWKDDFLTWTPATYGNIQSAHYPQLDIWKPPLALKNSNTDYKTLGVDELLVEVSYDGSVTWGPEQILTSQCSMDITYFPYDIQTCTLIFVVLGYSKAELYLRSQSSYIDLSEYSESPLWDVLSTSASLVTDDPDETQIHFTIQIIRKPLYYNIALVFPIIVLTILNIVVFLLPAESGEKAGYSVTVFLTFAVFLTIVTASLPKHSDSTSLFAVYVIIQTTLSTLITLTTLLELRVFTWDVSSQPVPLWLIKFLLLSGRKDKSVVPKKMQQVSPVPDSASPGLKSDDVTEKGEQEEDIDWKAIVNRLDLYFFVFFTVVAFLTTVICLSICSNNTRNL